MPDVLRGSQRPRLFNAPQGVRSDGADATELAAAADLILDPWQSYALECFLQIDAAGNWVTRDGLLVVPRQNGKGALLEAWELHRLFLKGSAGVLHTAHEASTAFDAFKKMRLRIEQSEWLSSRLKKDRSNGIRVANGEWGFTFKTGQQLNYKTRTTGAARGLTVDDLVIDEVQHLTDLELDALSSVVAAKPFAQTVMTGSAPIAGASKVLRRMVAAGRGGSPTLTYLEWSVDEMASHDLDDRRLWAQANPGYGIRLFDPTFLSDRMKQSDEGFAREHLGIVETDGLGVFAPGVWESVGSTDAQITTPTFALEVAEDRSWGCIAAAGKVPAGIGVELGENRRDTGWMVSRAAELAVKNSASQFVIKRTGPAAALIPGLKERGIRVVEMSQTDYAQACGMFYDAVHTQSLRHADQAAVNTAVRGAEKKISGDTWVFDPRGQVDITPLRAEVVAYWGHVVHGVDVSGQVF